MVRHIEQVTHLSRNVTDKLRNVELLSNSLSAGSKNRLKQYQRNLMVSRGTLKPLKDDQVISLIKDYVWNPRKVEKELQYLYSLKDDDGYLFSRNLKIYSTIEDAMLKFSSKDYTSFRWNVNYQKSLEWLRKKLKYCRLKPLEFHSDDEILNALPKVDTHSGYTWILSGKKYKGENIEGIYNIWMDEAKRALSLGTFQRPILIGFRTQASGEFTDDGEETHKCKHKLRVVSMFDLLSIVTELLFSVPFQEFMQNFIHYAGGKSRREISMILHNWEHKSLKFMSIDYSSFDQTISSWLIEDVFSIIKECFSFRNSEEEELWNIMVHDFIHKDFILGEGVLHSDKGVPSGSMWTQIIDTLVNLVVVRTYFESIHKDADMIAMGDDNVILSRTDVSISDLASYIIKNFGLIIKTDDKSNEGYCNRDVIKFLSTYWTKAGEWRHPFLLLSRLAFPERRRNYESEIQPQHVIYAYILTYPKGMRELMNVAKFNARFQLSEHDVRNVDNRYLPGALAYIRNYTYSQTYEGFG